MAGIKYIFCGHTSSNTSRSESPAASESSTQSTSSTKSWDRSSWVTSWPNTTNTAPTSTPTKLISSPKEELKPSLAEESKFTLKPGYCPACISSMASTREMIVTETRKRSLHRMTLMAMKGGKDDGILEELWPLLEEQEEFGADGEEKTRGTMLSCKDAGKELRKAGRWIKGKK